MRLEAQAHKLPGQLSGGQQQRVAIARATVIEPPLVLMDEPLSNLDAKLRLEMRAEIRRIHDLVGSTTIYVTHDQDEALSLADRIVVLRDGRVRQIGTPTELYARPAHADVAEFMGYRNIIPARASSGGNGVLRVRGRRRRARRARPSMRREGDVVVAFRPDDLTPRADGPLAAKVVTAEYRGRDFFGKAATTGGTELYLPLRREGGAGRYDPPRRRCLARAHLCRGRGMSTISIPSAAERSAEQRLPLRLRLAQRGLDGVTLLVLPAVFFLLALFVYPFLYGLVLSFEPKEGGWLANYQQFFSEPFLYNTISKTLWLAIPATLINILALGAGRDARAADAAAAPAHHHPRGADYARHGPDRGRAAQLSRPARLGEPHADDVRPDLEPDQAGAQLLGHADLAVHLRASRSPSC